MGKGKKRVSEKMDVKGEESAATNLKGRLLAPMKFSSTPSRWSIRILAKGQSSLIEVTNPLTQDSSTTEKVSSIAKLVTREPLSPKATRRSFVPENNNVDNETFEDNFCIKRKQVEAQVDIPPFFPLPDEVSEKGHTPNVKIMSLTELVEAKNYIDEESDEEIVSSASDVFYYGVKEEYASLIKKIFERYGNIAINHTLHSPMACSFFLEMVCGIIKRLQSLTFQYIKKEDLDTMLRELADVEISGIQVEWLRQKIKEIKKMKKEVKTIMSSSKVIKKNKHRVKSEIDEVRVDIKNYEILLTEKQEALEKFRRKIERDMESIREKKSELENKFDELKAESEEIDAYALDTRRKVHNLYHQHLIHGLL